MVALRLVWDSGRILKPGIFLSGRWEGQPDLSNLVGDGKAGWAQNGGTKDESNINNIMAYIRQQG